MNLSTSRIARLIAATAIVAVFTFASGATRSYANLTGSTFEGNDGNMIVDTSGNEDWCLLTATQLAAQNPQTCPKASYAPNLTIATDTPSGSTDSSFAMGAKEDFISPGVGDGSVPPNKNDLINFYTANEFVSSSNFLYLAFTRAATSGNADIDFEVNHLLTQTNPTTGDPITPLNRTDGDALFQFIFPGGGGPITSLQIWRWATSTSSSFFKVVPHVTTAAGCLNSSSFPSTGCWSDPTTPSASQFEGVSNATAINNPLDTSCTPSTNLCLATATFGEAAINLTSTNILPAGSCGQFGDAWAKSRAADSGSSDLKDLIAPVPVNISNCGEIKIIKHTDPRNLDQDFSYTSTIPDPVGTVTSSSSPYCPSDNTPSSFTLNDKTGGVNTEDCKNVQQGSYTVTEGAEPANFTLESLSCTATAGSSGTQHAANSPQADISLIPDGLVTCTYTNLQQLGAIKITKTSSKGGTALAGAKFKICTTSGCSAVGDPIASGLTTLSDGTACKDGLAFNTYYVIETNAPTGYKIDDTSAHSVTVNTNAKCSDAAYVGASTSFTDTPLSTIEVKFSSQSGTTSATITCKDESGTAITPDAGSTTGSDQTYSGLVPNSDLSHNYTCTVNIDP